VEVRKSENGIIVLTADESGNYGKDLNPGKDLNDLLVALKGIGTEQGKRFILRNLESTPLLKYSASLKDFADMDYCIFWASR